MNTEMHNSFQDGFLIKREELENIYNQIVSRAKMKSEDIEVKIAVGYQNKLEVEHASLDSIFAENNGGSQSIRSISINISHGSRTLPNDRYSIYFTVKADSTSIFYRIKGNDREWVLSTGNALEERIAKIKRKRLDEVTLILLTISVLGPTVLLMIGATITAFSLNASASLKTLLCLLSVTAIAALIFLIKWKYFFPAYNFCWGDYFDTFNDRKNKKNGIIFLIGVPLLLGIIGSVIATLLTLSISVGH